MSESPTHPQSASEEETVEQATPEADHPRGTLAIVLIYGALFVLGWLGLYVYVFLSRGAPRP